MEEHRAVMFMLAGYKRRALYRFFLRIQCSVIVMMLINFISFWIYPCIQAKVPINTVDGDGDGREGREAGKGKGAPLSPVALPFSLPPYPLTLSTPATQATLLLRT